jgi:hypothetical protein
MLEVKQVSAVFDGKHPAIDQFQHNTLKTLLKLHYKPKIQIRHKGIKFRLSIYNPIKNFTTCYFRELLNRIFRYKLNKQTESHKCHTFPTKIATINCAD